MRLYRPKKTTHKVRYLGLCVGLLTLLLGVSSLSAQGVSSIAQGFQTTDSNVVAGALVSLKAKTANSVELADTANLEALTGVVGNKSLIELSNGGSSVQVVTSGITPTLVSDINGDVKIGDKITVSPIAGVGMKATQSTLVVGAATTNLSSAKTSTRTVTDKDGKQRQVHIGAVQMQVDKVFYQAPTDQNSYLPPALQSLADGIVGRQVSPIRVLVAAVLMLFLFGTVVVMLYSSVRSSIISIGRNPLSESAVRKSLLQVGLTILGILACTVTAIYLILTL